MAGPTPKGRIIEVARIKSKKGGPCDLVDQLWAEPHKINAFLRWETNGWAIQVHESNQMKARKIAAKVGFALTPLVKPKAAPPLVIQSVEAAPVKRGPGRPKKVEAAPAVKTGSKVTGAAMRLVDRPAPKAVAKAPPVVIPKAIAKVALRVRGAA